MPWADDLTELLEEEIRKPSGTVGISAYRFCLDEGMTVTAERTARATARGTLTLMWEDGSISNHRISPPQSKEEGLPVRFWQSGRYFDNRLRRLPKPPASPLPDIPLFDPDVIRLQDRLRDDQHEQPGELLLCSHTRTVRHSRGLHLQTKMTEVRVSVRPSPFVYRSRRMPSEKEAEYVQTEAAWFGMHKLAPLRGISSSSFETKLLLTPDAFRSLLFHAYSQNLHQPSTRDQTAAFGRKLSARSRLIIRYDPLVPWSAGSCPFTASGLVSTSCDILREPDQLPPDGNPDAFHWSMTPSAIPFREWMAGQQDVLYVPTWRLCTASHSFVQAWVPEAYRFQQGRPTEKGSMHIPLTLASVLMSPSLEVVLRPGWDCGGLALPVVQLFPE